MVLLLTVPREMGGSSSAPERAESSLLSPAVLVLATPDAASSRDISWTMRLMFLTRLRKTTERQAARSASHSRFAYVN